MSQLDLLGGSAPVELGVKLTERQQFALELVGRLQPVESDEVGAHLCERRGKHPSDQRCEWDAQNGRGVLRALRAKGFVQQKKGSGWVLAGYRQPRAPEPVREGLDEHGFPEGF